MSSVLVCGAVGRMGEHVLRDLVPLRRMVDAGVDVCCGSDWGPKNMFEQIALAMWTRNSAAILGWPGIGSLQPGNRADLIVVDRAP